MDVQGITSYVFSEDHFTIKYILIQNQKTANSQFAWNTRNFVLFPQPITI